MVTISNFLRQYNCVSGEAIYYQLVYHRNHCRVTIQEISKIYSQRDNGALTRYIKKLQEKYPLEFIQMFRDEDIGLGDL